MSQAPSYPRVDSEEYLEMRARSTDPATSHEPARQVDAAGQRGLILNALVVGDAELTADELDTWIGWRVTTAGRRLSELKRRGLVEACGQRYTRSGRQATVYRCVS